jgi:hypothetical protein
MCLQVWIELADALLCPRSMVVDGGLRCCRHAGPLRKRPRRSARAKAGSPAKPAEGQADYQQSQILLECTSCAPLLHVVL